MFSPEEQQIEICLLKSNLEEIENDLVGQRSVLPALESENEQKYRETMAALGVARSLNTEMERLKLENMRLTAKSTQLKRQCDALSKAVENARSYRNELVDSLKQEELEIEQHIRKYEDSLEEIADRFRKTKGYYNEGEMVGEINNINKRIIELKEELGRRQSVVDKLRQQFNEIQPEVSGEFLTIIGKNQLLKKVKSLTEKYEALEEKRNQLTCQRRNDENKIRV